MDVGVDNVWASPSTLHVRVTVCGDHMKWRHKYDVAIPWDTVPEEALEPWLKSLGPGRLSHDPEQLPLF